LSFRLTEEPLIMDFRLLAYIRLYSACSFYNRDYIFKTY
jgi:hypothetical protein